MYYSLLTDDADGFSVEKERPGYKGILLIHGVKPVFLMSNHSKEGSFIIVPCEFYMLCINHRPLSG